MNELRIDTIGFVIYQLFLLVKIVLVKLICRLVQILFGKHDDSCRLKEGDYCRAALMSIISTSNTSVE
jgi:hypothetical protein